MLRLMLLAAFFIGCIAPPSLLAQSASIFDGSDDKATAYHHSDFNIGTGDFTIEAIVRNIPGEKSKITLLSKRSLTSNGIILYLNTDNGYTFHAQLGKKQYQINASALEDGSCHSLTIKRSRGNLSMFIDDTGTALGANSVDISTTADVIIGADGAPTHNNFDGIIEEIRFWGIARRDIEITENNESCIDPSTSGLIAYWNIEENAGQFFHDVAQVQHHAYLGNSFNVDALDPSWTSNECPEACCEAQAGFTVDVTNPRAFQYASFTNTSTNASNYDWYVNGTLEATSTDFQQAFTIGTHIITLVAHSGVDCKSLQSIVIEVTDFLDNCGAPASINNCNFDPFESQEQMRIFDGFGNCYLPEEIALPAPSPQKSAVPGYPAGQVCECGIFTLYFQDVINATGVGFDDSNPSQGSGYTGISTLGDERRAVLCRVFEDLTELIGTNATAAALSAEDLRISIGESDGTSVLDMPSFAAGVGTAYFQEYTSPNIHKFALSEVSKTILTGQDSYLGWNLYNPSLSTAAHGIVQFNFPNVSFNSDLGAIGTPVNHLYSTALHEALHALGFRSLIGDDVLGESVFANSNAPNIYAFWDQFLESNQSPAITGTYTGGILNVSSNAPFNSCSSAPAPTNGMAFDEVPTSSNHPVFYNGGYIQGSTFSHYNCTAGVSNYIMNFNGISGVTPNALEVETLCRLGYTISGNFGQNLSGNSPSESNTYASYTACTPTCIPVGLADFENTAGTPFVVNRTGTLNEITINFSDLWNNDVNVTAIEGLQVLQGGEAVPLTATSSASASSFTYSPNLGFGINWAVLTYTPVCSTGERGEQTYVFIWVPAAAIPACNIPISSCNIVCNGDFENYEAGIGGQSQLENFNAHYSGNMIKASSVDLVNLNDPIASPVFRSFISSVLTSASSIWSDCQGVYSPQDVLSPLGPNNNKYVGIGHVLFQSGISGNAEMVYLPLEHALVPNLITDNYRLTFSIYTPCDNFNARFVFSNGAPCDQSSGTSCDLRADNGGSTYVPNWAMVGGSPTACPTWGNETDHHGLNIPVVNPNPSGALNWFTVTHDFRVTKSNLEHLILHLDKGAITGPNGSYALLDNITIEHIDQPKINITSTIIGNTCPGATPIIQYTIEGDASIPLGSPLTNVQLDITLPTSIPPTLSYATGGSFTNGQFTIPTLNQGDIITLTLPLDIAGNAIIGSSHQVLINATAAGACVSSASNQNTNIVIANPASHLAINTTILSNSASAVQYQIEVTNTGPDDIFNIDLEVPTVAGLSFTFNPALFTLVGGNSQTFVLNASTNCGGSPMNATLCAEINSANFACNLPVAGCAPTVSVGGAGSGPDFPIEAEDPLHNAPSLFSATAHGSNGDVVSVGLFSDDINFVEGLNTNTLNHTTTCTNSLTPFIVKYNSCGFEWAVEIPACWSMGYLTGVPDVEVGLNGDIYVAFPFTGSFVLNSNTYTAQGVDIAIIKYNSNGVPIWVQTEGGLGDDTVSDIETYHNGTSEEVYIVGTLYGTTGSSVTFTTSPSTTINYITGTPFCSSCNPGGGIPFVAAYTDNGTTINNDWVQSINATGFISSKLAIDPTGNVYTTGITNTNFTFNNSPIGSTITTVNQGIPSSSNNDVDIFVLKYDNSGNEDWAEVYGSTGLDFLSIESFKLSVDIECESTTHLGLILSSAPTTLTGTQPYMQNWGTHLLRLNASNGSLSWVVPAANPTTSANGIPGNFTYHSNLAINGTDYLINGSFYLEDPLAPSASGFSSINFHGTTINYTTMAAHPTYDRYQGTFIENFDNLGNLQWVNANTSIVPLPPAVDQHSNRVPLDIECDNSGNIYTSSYLRGTATFGLNNVTGGVNGNQDVVDGFITKIDGALGTYLRPTANNNNAFNYNLPSKELDTNQKLGTDLIDATNNFTTKLYPNPTTGKVTLEISSSLEQQQIEQISIYDVTGRKIQQVQVSDGSQTQFDINLETQQPGVYFVEIMINQALITKRVILMN